jgi:hypothetical protein
MDFAAAPVANCLLQPSRIALVAIARVTPHLFMAGYLWQAAHKVNALLLPLDHPVRPRRFDARAA